MEQALKECFENNRNEPVSQEVLQNEKEALLSELLRPVHQSNVGTEQQIQQIKSKCLISFNQEHL